jgi:hypothetical protein
VVQELRGAADALEGQLAGDDSDHEDEADEDDDAHGDGDSTSGLAPLVGAMTELVAELRASRTGKPTTKAGRKGGKTAPPGRGAGGAREDDDEQDEEEDDEEEDPPVRRGPPPRPMPKRKDAGARSCQGQGLQADMRALRGDLKTFTSSIAEHARRLSKLEKRSAPPSSRPAGERPGAGRTNDEAWPLDLNASRGR